MYKIIPKIRRLSILQFEIFILQLLLFACSCEKSTTEPPPPPPAGPDTTSHNFTWQIDTIGLYSSYLLDVAIVDENDIWAVGEIHTAETDTFDSLGNWIPPYNAVHWNGQEWELKRIPIKIFGTNSFIIAPLQAIWAFDRNSVWVTTGGEVIRYNGISWGGWEFLFTDLNDTAFGGIKKFWGVSNSTLWGVGRKGNIFYYNGSNWQKLESGTTVDIQDIWGALNPQSGEYEILAVASFGPVVPQAKQLLQIRGTAVTTVSDSGLPLSLRSVWFVAGKKYYITGDGVFFTEKIGHTWQPDTAHPLIYKDAIRGDGVNDIIIAGSFGLVSHFNGSTWRHYTGSELPSFYGRYYAVNFNGHQMAAVGTIGAVQAILLKGTRY